MTPLMRFHPPLRPTPGSGTGVAPWREELVGRLNDSLATELAYVLHYNHRHPTARGLAGLRSAQRCVPQALRDLWHVDRLARYVVQLGGQPGFPTHPASAPCHAAYAGAWDLGTLIKAHLAAERAVIATCVRLVHGTDAPGSAHRGLIGAILADEQAQLDALGNWFDD